MDRNFCSRNFFLICLLFREPPQQFLLVVRASVVWAPEPVFGNAVMWWGRGQGDKGFVFGVQRCCGRRWTNHTRLKALGLWRSAVMWQAMGQSNVLQGVGFVEYSGVVAVDGSTIDGSRNWLWLKEFGPVETSGVVAGCGFHHIHFG